MNNSFIMINILKASIVQIIYLSTVEYKYFLKCKTNYYPFGILLLLL